MLIIFYYFRELLNFLIPITMTVILRFRIENWNLNNELKLFLGRKPNNIRRHNFLIKSKVCINLISIWKIIQRFFIPKILLNKLIFISCLNDKNLEYMEHLPKAVSFFSSLQILSPKFFTNRIFKATFILDFGSQFNKAISSMTYVLFWNYCQ